MHGYRAAWPAVAISGTALLTLAIVLNALQAPLPVEPVWIVAVIGGVYLLLALGLCGLTWHWPVTFALMAAAHALAALLMGWGYAAVQGVSWGAVPAFTHGLWDSLPGTALQAAFALLTGPVIAAALKGAPHANVADDEDVIYEDEEEEEDTDAAVVPDFSSVTSRQEAVELACTTPGVAGAVIAAGETFGSGVWAADPHGAAQRARLLGDRCGSGLASVTAGEAILAVRCEQDRVVALLAQVQTSVAVLHEVLRRLYHVTEADDAEDESSAEDTEPVAKEAGASPTVPPQS